MHLHKYKEGDKTFYAITNQHEAPKSVDLSKAEIDSVPVNDTITSLISELNAGIDTIIKSPEESKKPEESEEPKKPKESEEPEEPKKTAVSEIIRKYAQMLGSLNKE